MGEVAGEAAKPLGLSRKGLKGIDFIVFTGYLNP